MEQVYSAGRPMFTLVFNLDELLGSANQRTATLRWLDFWLKSIVLDNPDAPLVLVGTRKDVTWEADDLRENNSKLAQTHGGITRAHALIGEHISKMAMYKENQLKLQLPEQCSLSSVYVCACAC